MAHGLTTVDEVRQHTNASGGCGVCAVRIEDILAALPAAAGCGPRRCSRRRSRTDAWRRSRVGKKACAVNPLKMSQPIGGAFAFMGLRGAMPLLHGSQGCTSFGLTLFVRHFKEAVPLQTTAMSEVATVLGGYENVEQAILNIHKRTKPEIIGICSTGVTETKGDDVEGYHQADPAEASAISRHFPLVYVSTPDFKDAFQDGWEKTVARMVEVLVETPKNAARRDPARVNVLPGCHLTPGDLDELRTIIEDFGLEPSFLPDLAGSLDGHIPDEFVPTTIGGIGVDEIAAMGQAAWTIAIGAQMRRAAEAMEAKTGVPFRLFERLCGLAPNDEFIVFLSEISGRPVPLKYRRQRGQLADAMLDAHFHIGGRKLAIGAEPDLLFDLSQHAARDGRARSTRRGDDDAIAGAGADQDRGGADRRSRGSRKPGQGPRLRSPDHPFAWPAGGGAARNSVLSRRVSDVRPARRRARSSRSAIAAPAI